MVFIIVMALGFMSYSIVEGLIILRKFFKELEKEDLLERKVNNVYGDNF